MSISDFKDDEIRPAEDHIKVSVWQFISFGRNRMADVVRLEFYQTGNERYDVYLIRAQEQIGEKRLKDPILTDAGASDPYVSKRLIAGKPLTAAKDICNATVRKELIAWKAEYRAIRPQELAPPALAIREEGRVKFKGRIWSHGINDAKPS